jgi:aminobenzoyl-glutamate transport protein
MTKNSKHKKIVLHPVISFIILSLIVLIVSFLASAFNIGATYNKINPITKELEPYLVTVNSLLNTEGIQYIISNITKNFIGFIPLVTMLIAFIGLGIAEKSGLLKKIILDLTSKLNKKTVTFILILLSIISTINIETSYVLLLPLGALIFYLNGRNPLAGIVATFAGISFGAGANAIINSLDINLSTYTSMAANIIDNKYQISLMSSIFITTTLTLATAWVGMIVTEKIIVPKLGRYKFEPEQELEIEESYDEKRGIIFSSIASTIVILFFMYMIIPGLPYSGILLDKTADNYLYQLFSSTSYFQEGFLIIITVLLSVAGIFYGIGSRKFKNNIQIVEAMNGYAGVAISSVVLIFFASQFINIFKKTNIGTILVAWCTGIIKAISFSGIPLIIVTLIIIALAGLFITSSVVKWGILAPTVVPTLMQLNISPEFSQVIYRAGDTITKGVTPLLAYFVIFISLLNYYNKDKDHPITIKKCISLTLPYSMAYAIMWIFILVSWYIIGLPIGPGVYPTV